MNKRISNTKGVTMMELIVAMLVFSIIMAAAMSVFAPMLTAFRRANNFAEANTLLDNLAMHVMADINNAVGNNGIPRTSDDDEDLIIRTPAQIRYYVEEGHLWREVSAINEGNWVTVREPVLPAGFYHNHSVRISSFNWVWHPSGLVEVTFEITHTTDGWARERTYTARPVGLVVP
jgi:prepilin-type N-terminal cleavage/methylation domain-containing protein